MKVVYGHTDSIYVEMEDDDISKAEDVLQILNTHVREKFPNLLGLEEHPVTLEFEKFFKTLGVGCKKNRNAGLISWKDGEFLDELQFTMTGFTAKRVAITPLAKEIQLEVLDRWVKEQSEEEITSFLQSEYQKVLSGDIEISKLAQRSRYREERFSVKCSNCAKEGFYSKRKNPKISLMDLVNDPMKVCCNNPTYVTLRDKRAIIGSGVEGVIYHNYTNPDNQIEDSYLYLKIVGVTDTYYHPMNKTYVNPRYISKNTYAELEGYTPDYRHYASSIVSKAEPIYEAMGWDVTKIMKDNNQTELDEWF